MQAASSRVRHARFCCSACIEVLALLATYAVPAFAILADCPLAHRPYSSRTLLIDLLADPRARAVLERDAPIVMGPITGKAGFQLPPPFMKIITPDFLLTMAPAERARVRQLLDRIGRSLADACAERGALRRL